MVMSAYNFFRSICSYYLNFNIIKRLLRYNGSSRINNQSIFVPCNLIRSNISIFSHLSFPYLYTINIYAIA